MTTASSDTALLPHLFRQEYAKMTAVLCRHFGLEHMEIAEDIASDTFLKATELWPVRGIPDNPTAWLYAVAKNKTKDYFRRNTVFEQQVKDAVREQQQEAAFQPEPEFSSRNIADSQLAMMFLVCSSDTPPESQICLVLQVLCGFSVEEIATAFLSKPETIKKRLYRARTSLRNEDFTIRSLSEAAIASGMETVLKTLYLLFNEGYFSKSGNQLIRKDLCSEAVRLCLALAENPLTGLPQTNALLSLMCFQSSRLDARISESGASILFEEQDRRLWDQMLIEKGIYYLIAASSGKEISKYHLEAGIAYWHTVEAEQDKWQHILQLYNQLLLIAYSPVTALNRAFACSKVYGHSSAIAEAELLQLKDNSYYHSLLGYLYAERDADKAVAHYRQAIALTRSGQEQQTLAAAIERLTRKKR